MNMLASLTTSEEIVNEKDSIGGNATLDSAIYPMSIGMAYLKKSDGGALGLHLTLKSADGKETRQAVYITSGNDKGNKNYYEKDGVKNYLPGFNMANSLCLLTVGKEISQMETEEKVLNIYSSDAKAEVPTKVQVIMELLNQDILVGLLKQTVDKTSKGDDGKYHPTGETREENEIDKLFRAKDKLTTAEIRAQVTEPAFHDAWAKKWTGQVKNKASKATGTAGAPGATSSSAAGTKKPGASLFG
jgi:hypothetical protein